MVHVYIPDSNHFNSYCSWQDNCLSRLSSLPEMEDLRGKRTVSRPIGVNKERNGPPNNNQVLSAAKPRHFSALRVNPPSFPCPTLSVHAESISQRHCQQ